MERGGNLRERDLATAFHLAIQEVGRVAPDLVVLAGDLFDRPDPPSTAFLTLTRGVRRLQELLPGVPVLAIAGECDTPASSGDPGPVAVLDAVPGVEAAAGAPRAVHFRALNAHVLLVPHRAVVRPPFPELRPDPEARWNILVVRGQPGIGIGIGIGVGGRAGAGGPGLEDAEGGLLGVDPGDWDYVAVGGPHEAGSWGARARTPGSLERVGADPWREGGAEKGFLVADLALGRVDFHPLPSRPTVDLASVRVEASAPDEGTRRLRALVEEVPGGVDGKLVRVRLRGDVIIPTEGIAPPLLAGVRRRAAHVEVRVEGPEASPGVQREGGPGDGGRCAAPRLSWTLEGGGGRTGAVDLIPGLWAVTGQTSEELARLARALEACSRGEGEGDPRGGVDAPRYAFAIEGGILRAPPREAGPGSRVGGRAEEDRPPDDDTSPDEGALRADWIEVEGDAEARALEWVRERQEADSRLVAYRERARELRDRIRLLRDEGAQARCPTCKRPLEEAHPGLLALLEEEWEDVVQDGSWWKRRRAQLEDKPAELLELERRALRLRAELDRGVHPGVRAPGTTDSAAGGGVADGPGVSRDALRSASFLLRRATEGELDGVVPGDGGELHVVEAGGRQRPIEGGEAELVGLALRAARATLEPPSEAHRGEGGDGGAVHLLLALRSGSAPGQVARLLEALAERPGGERAWIAVVPPEVVDLLGSRLSGVLESVREDPARTRIRVRHPGIARIALRTG
jgi:DNA repair protein SbcD/Mre11